MKIGTIFGILGNIATAPKNQGMRDERIVPCREYYFTMRECK